MTNTTQRKGRPTPRRHEALRLRRQARATVQGIDYRGPVPRRAQPVPQALEDAFLGGDIGPDPMWPTILGKLMGRWRGTR